MLDFGKQEYVCDLTHIMRVRLLCGLYNRRSISPCFQRFAQVYCMITIILFSLYTYSLIRFGSVFSLLNWLPGYGQYVLASFVSLWTGDEYLYKFFTQNKMTDITLDSHTIFRYFQKQMKNSYIFGFVIYLLTFGLSLAVSLENDVITIVAFIIPPFVLNLFVLSTYTSKLLVIGLFNSRILVLRRRLERHGFRRIGRAPPQPYCQIYDEIWQGLNATDNPLKVMLFFDMIFGSSQLISNILILVYRINWQDSDQKQSITLIALALASIIKILVVSFGHVALLESADAHCEGVVVFTATQLIKAPSPTQRKRMYALLRAVEQRGARYRVLRALPLNARLVLQAVGFCSAQVLVFSSIIQPK